MSQTPTFAAGEAPAAFDELIDWYEGICQALVLLVEIPLLVIRDATERFARGVEGHRTRDSEFDPAGSSDRPGVRSAFEALRADHERLATSIRQLWWFFEIVAHDDHGGNRQALGQYGKVVTEAIRRHRAEERVWLERSRGGPSAHPATPVASNDK